MFEENRSHRLRRLITELAECHRDDIDAILDTLSPTARERVENLLGEYHRTAAEPVLALDTKATDFGSLRLSSWLIERLSAIDVSEPEKMTGHARNVLRSCALGLFPQAGLSDQANSPGNPSLLTRMRTAWVALLRGAK